MLFRSGAGGRFVVEAEVGGEGVGGGGGSKRTLVRGLAVKLRHLGELVAGDSMVDAAICDGDYVVVREQNSAVNGDIVAALLDDEATVKTFRKENGHVWLMPHNPAYSPIDGTHATIMGKVVTVLRKL